MNELKIAAEDILLYGLWNPLDQWKQHEGDTNKDFKLFSEKSAELTSKRISPDLSHFELVCRYPIVAAFLDRKGCSSDEKEWFIKVLPGRLAWLRRERRNAEHESGHQWTRGDLNKYYAEFIGIGQRGILPQIARILFL